MDVTLPPEEKSKFFEFIYFLNRTAMCEKYEFGGVVLGILNSLPM